MRMTALLILGVASCVGVTGILTAGDEDAIHDLRVAVRRLRLAGGEAVDVAEQPRCFEDAGLRHLLGAEGAELIHETGFHHFMPHQRRRPA